MSNIIEFKKPDESVPCIEGDAICLCCKQEWLCVAEVGIIELECPSCGSSKGVFKHMVLRSCDHFQCNCGNFLFHIAPQGIYCTNCATWVNPYE